jgi:ferrous iron transport protein B
MNKNIKIAISGNPNSGKTTLFNALTGSNQRIGNYPGVTVEKREGFFKFKDICFSVTDLPGTYSLTARSIEEKIARDFVSHSHPDLVVNIIDASNFERNMYLAVQLIELGVKLILVLNMSDRAKAMGQKIDMKAMAERLGVWVVETTGHKKIGLDQLKETIVRALRESKPNVNVDYGDDIERDVSLLADKLKAEEGHVKDHALRWLALKLLEEDKEVIDDVRRNYKNGEQIVQEAYLINKQLTKHLGDTPETIATERRYGFIAGLFRELAETSITKRLDLSDKVDNFLTHKFFGIPIFLGLMYFTFKLTFTMGEPFMNIIELAFENLKGLLLALWPHGSGDSLKSLVIDGVIGGVGGVIVFLPNILFLFLAIAVLEGTGYMARAAFLVDRLMHKIGLHGKSFIPMLIGFGCSVPAIMATRTLENKQDRLTTILVIPLMSCGARLPIYALIIPAFFPSQYHGELLFLIYLIGIGLAILLAKLLRSTLFSGDTMPFVMELPPYRMPTIGALLMHMWERTYLYLKKAGTIILAISVVMWAMTAYPKKTEYEIDQKIAAGYQFSSQEIESLRKSEDLQFSIAGRVGKGLEVIFKPLGFDWKIGTALIGSFAAKEVFVSQMGIVFSLGDVSEDSVPLRKKMKNNYPPIVGFCIMLFALIASPCMATVAITKREAGAWKWALLQFFGLTLIAYILTLLVYQIGVLF